MTGAQVTESLAVLRRAVLAEEERRREHARRWEEPRVSLARMEPEVFRLRCIFGEMFPGPVSDVLQFDECAGCLDPDQGDDSRDHVCSPSSRSNWVASAAAFLYL
jgi:hypothetical protein